MAEKDDPAQPAAGARPPRDARAERQKAALKANMARRKAQARARQDVRETGREDGRDDRNG